MPVSTNAYLVAANLDLQGETAQAKADKKTKHFGMLLETKVKANASGRPGPRVITGNYRRSWNARHMGGISIVGTNAPQARRLEYGFTGVDSLGRNYHQPPFPHVGPAVAVIQPAYFESLGDIPQL